MYQTFLADNDPRCLFAGIISGIYSSFCNFVFKFFDLYTVWYQITAETKCCTVFIECQQSKTLVNYNFSWMLHRSEMCTNYFGCCESSYFISRYLSFFFLFFFGHMKPKSLATECILVGFEMHNSEMYNNIQYTNKAVEPCLPLKYWVYPKRSFHVGDSFPSHLNHGCVMKWSRCWVNPFGYEKGYLMCSQKNVWIGT